MKKVKRFSALTLVVVLALIMTACKAGVPSYDLSIDPVTGGGKANFTIRVPKNDAPEVGNNFDKEGEAGYIESPEALLELFKKSVPNDFSITLKDEPKMVTNDDGDEKDQGNYAYTLTFSFKGIDDYNQKIMKLVGQASWDGANASAKAVAEAGGNEFVKIVPATMTYEPAGDKQTVTFTEDLRVLDVISYWAYTVLTADTTGVWNDVYKDTYPDYPVAFENTINLDLAKYSIDFGGDVQEFRHSSDPIVTMKATVDAVEVVEDTTDDTKTEDTTEPTTTEMPDTGSNSVTAIVLAIGAGLSLIILVFTQKKFKKIG